MTPKKRIERLEAAAARREDIEPPVPREPDAIERMFASPEALAAELARGRCGRLLLLPPDELHFRFGQPCVDRPLTAAEAERVAILARELAELIFAKCAAAATPQEKIAAVHSHLVVTEALLRSQQEWWREQNEEEWNAGQDLGGGKAAALPSMAELTGGGMGEHKAIDGNA